MLKILLVEIMYDKLCQFILSNIKH